MKQIKNLLIGSLYILASILILTFITTLLSYVDILKDKIIPIIQILISIISFFIGGMCIGKNTSKKRFIEGAKLGLLFSIILVLFSTLILNNKFELKYIFYYCILIFSSTLGSMICIEKKNN